MSSIKQGTYLPPDPGKLADPVLDIYTPTLQMKKVQNT